MNRFAAARPSGEGWGVFRKSSFSESGNCVEIAFQPAAVLVRNSRKPDSGTIEFTSEEWSAFLKGAAAGEFRHPSWPADMG